MKLKQFQSKNIPDFRKNLLTEYIIGLDIFEQFI